MKKSPAFCDLHIHSVYSDGGLFPGDIVRRASGYGLRAVSITDHDTVRGQREALKAGAAERIEVITGIEFSSRPEDMDIHILGYLIEPENSSLVASLRWLREERMSRIKNILAKLDGCGISVSLDEVLPAEANDSVGRPHVARALMKAGVVNRFQEAFSRFLGFGKRAYVPSTVLSLDRIMELISGAGGVSVWAHPGNKIRNESLLERMISLGLSGLEAWHPNHDSSLEEEIRETALGYGLIPTGGSDFHFKEAMKVDIGGKGAPYSSVVRLKEAAETGHLS